MRSATEALYKRTIESPVCVTIDAASHWEKYNRSQNYFVLSFHWGKIHLNSNTIYIRWYIQFISYCIFKIHIVFSHFGHCRYGRRLSRRSIARLCSSHRFRPARTGLNQILLLSLCQSSLLIDLIIIIKDRIAFFQIVQIITIFMYAERLTGHVE